MAFRLDTGSILRAPKRTPDGALRVDATFTRTGVFVYRDAKGNEFREYRPPEEVFDAESIASFEALPVTDGHPPVMVDPNNVGEYKRGRSGDTVKRDGIHMVGALIIDDVALIERMSRKDGPREVSNGYACDLDMTPGVSPEGERYDAVQRNIRGNHVAIVDAGRAGTARVRMDGAAFQVPEPVTSTGNNTRTDGDVMNLEQALAALHAANVEKGKLTEQLANETKRADAAEQRAKDAETKATTAEAKADAADQRAKTAETKATEATAAADKARTDAATEAKASIKARTDLVVKALAAGVQSIKVDGADVQAIDAEPRALKLAVIAKLDGAEVPAEKQTNEAYVDARFDISTSREAASGKAFAQLTAIVNAPAKTDQAPAGTPGTETAEMKARKAMHADYANAHKNTATEAK